MRSSSSEQNEKDPIMKMLLSAPNQAMASNVDMNFERRKMLGKKEADDTGASKLSNYLHQLSGQGETVLSTVDLDHNYSRPWNWRPENSYTKPVKTLFIPRSSSTVRSSLDKGELDIEGVAPAPVYDCTRAKQAMDETGKNITLVRNHPGDSDWEMQVDRSEWSVSQTRLFERISRVLNHDRLARLALQDSWNEPVLRRVAINKTASRFRSTFASISWEPKLLQWIHNLLIDVLDTPNLIAYVDVLQTLKSKIPTMVERILANAPPTSKTNQDALNMLLSQKPWDPVTLGLNRYNPKKLPGNPVLIMVPSSPSNGYSSNSRLIKWQSYLSQLGSVVSVHTPIGSGSNKIGLMSTLEQMMAAIRAKISEISSDYMGKHVILVGINSGAALACQVALLEPVTAVVCLGFPMNTAEDKRGQPDDNLLNMNVPVLFVIGQHAATTSVDDIEDLRERLHVETGLVVVGAADDQLRITKSKQGAEGITQSMVDKCVVDEVGDFIGTILSNPQTSTRNEVRQPRLKLVERKRHISIQDEIYGRKQLRKPRITRGGGAGRPKWTAQDTGTGSVASITRTPEKSIAQRPLIDNISVVNAAPNDGDSVCNTAVDPSTAKLLPQIKVLRSEECGMVVDSSLVEHLTPDSLLEMPVIIAQEDTNDLPVKVVVSSTSRRGSGVPAIRCIPKVSNKVNCTKIFLRKKLEVNTREGLQSANFMEGRGENGAKSKRRIRHIPAAKRTQFSEML